MKTRMIFAATFMLLVACNAPPEQGAVRAQSQPQSQPRQQQQQFGSLDQLLAPIALYPDSLLAQILMCAGTPAKVTELDTWLQNNRNLKGTQLQDAAVRAGFEPSFVALALFPSVVSNMAVQLQWTTTLGQAFAADRNAVFAAIQKLRHQAQDVGTLKDSAQQDVSTKTTSSGEQVIVIEPANPQVIYVPQYNTQTVYTTAPTTVVVQDTSSSADAAVAAGLIGFTAGIAIGAAVNNNYYYGPYGWHGGAYMYNDAWDDYYDAREDAREDWQDHREDMYENRSDRAEDARENRGERTENRSETRGTTQEQRTERQQNRTENRPESTTQRTQQRAQTSTQSATTSGTRRTGSAEARGYGGGQAATARSSGSSDAFSGYSSGSSQRASSNRGQQSRSSSRGGGGGRRR